MAFLSTRFSLFLQTEEMFWRRAGSSHAPFVASGWIPTPRPAEEAPGGFHCWPTCMEGHPQDGVPWGGRAAVAPATLTASIRGLGSSAESVAFLSLSPFSTTRHPAPGTRALWWPSTRRKVHNWSFLLSLGQGQTAAPPPAAPPPPRLCQRASAVRWAQVLEERHLLPSPPPPSPPALTRTPGKDGRGPKCVWPVQQRNRVSHGN